MNRIIGIIFFFCTNVYAQLNLDQCAINISENFSPKVLELTDTYLLRHAHNENTLYLHKGNSVKIFSFQNYGVIKAVIDKDENFLAIANYNKKIEIFKIKDKNKIKSIKNLNSKAFALQFYKQKLFCGLSDGTVLVDSILTSKRLLLKAHTDVIRDICIYDSMLLTISHDGFLKAWDLNNAYKNLKNINFKKVLTKIAISNDKKSIAIGFFDGSVVILDDKFKQKVKFKPNKSIITQLKFKDNKTIISASFDKKIISTNIDSLQSEVLFESKDYIITFDFIKNKFIYSDHSGTIYYHNLDCTIKQ